MEGTNCENTITVMPDGSFLITCIDNSQNTIDREITLPNHIEDHEESTN